MTGSLAEGVAALEQAVRQRLNDAESTHQQLCERGDALLRGCRVLTELARELRAQLDQYEPETRPSDVEERDRVADARAVCERLADDLGAAVYTASVCHSMLEDVG